jgi:acyl-ACP thioesterase
MADIWSEKADIRFGCVDRSDRLTLGSIFSFFQEAAISHAAELGVGRDALARAGQAWILSRLSLFAERRPAYGETVEIRTWPRGFEKLFALRDYTILDADSAAVVRGRGAWLVLDTEKRRPLRVQPLVEPLPPNHGINAFQMTGVTCPAGLRTRENLSKKGERAALYSDIDYYGHANNARYIQWIQDAMDMDTLTDAGRMRLDINYLSEVLPGDTVELWTASYSLSDGESGETKRGENIAEEDYPSPPGKCFAFEGRRPPADVGGSFPAENVRVVFRAELYTGG